MSSVSSTPKYEVQKACVKYLQNFRKSCDSLRKDSTHRVSTRTEMLGESVHRSQWRHILSAAQFTLSFSLVVNSTAHNVLIHIINVTYKVNTKLIHQCVPVVGGIVLFIK